MTQPTDTLADKHRIKTLESEIEHLTMMLGVMGKISRELLEIVIDEIKKGKCK